MVEEYDEIADSQYPSERVEYLDEDYGMMIFDLMTRMRSSSSGFACSDIGCCMCER